MIIIIVQSGGNKRMRGAGLRETEWRYTENGASRNELER